MKSLSDVLKLNKETVASLDSAEMANVKGGFTSSLRSKTNCKTDCDCAPCCPKNQIQQTLVDAC